MLKNLSFITVACLLATGCVIDLGNTTSASETDTSQGTSGTGTTGGTTAAETTGGTTTAGTTTAGTGTTAQMPTTDGPTTTTGGTTTEGTTTMGSAYGKCGWNADEKFYACDQFGGVPGEIDPASPIDCPAELPTVGDKCDETTPVNNVGCCLPNGQNWYCTAEGMIAMDECGA